MQVIGNLFTGLKDIPTKVQQLETLGYDCAFSAEINNDPFFPLLLAAEHSDQLELMTSIAVAFARNPMTLANLAHDLNEYSDGRFILGIGSQIKPHITRRMSMPWSQPAKRMREFILAMRAIWDCWNKSEKLDFRGEFYQHTLMTPMFVPGNVQQGAPRVHLAAVGPMMTEVAAEVADGMIAHGFTTEKYLREISMPAIDRGLAKAGRARKDFLISSPIMVIAGESEEAFERSKNAVKMQLAFYASTPAYRPVLDLHGWGDLQPRANELSKQGKWVEMGELINDQILDAFAVVCEDLEQIPAVMAGRYSNLVDSWQCTFECDDPARQRALIQAVQQQE
jgi:probable F420-dependent oxidoreductase